jgi:hypothetical protein
VIDTIKTPTGRKSLLSVLVLPSRRTVFVTEYSGISTHPEWHETLPPLPGRHQSKDRDSWRMLGWAHSRPNNYGLDRVVSGRIQTFRRSQRGNLSRIRRLPHIARRPQGASLKGRESKRVTLETSARPRVDWIKIFPLRNF